MNNIIIGIKRLFRDTLNFASMLCFEEYAKHAFYIKWSKCGLLDEKWEAKSNPRLFVVEYQCRSGWECEMHEKRRPSILFIVNINSSGLCSLHPVNLNDRKTLAVNFTHRPHVDHSAIQLNIPLTCIRKWWWLECTPKLKYADKIPIHQNISRALTRSVSRRRELLIYHIIMLYMNSPSLHLKQIYTIRFSSSIYKTVSIIFIDDCTILNASFWRKQTLNAL